MSTTKEVVTPKQNLVTLIHSTGSTWSVNAGGIVRGFITGIGNTDGTRAAKWTVTGASTTYPTRGEAIDAALMAPAI